MGTNDFVVIFFKTFIKLMFHHTKENYVTLESLKYYVEQNLSLIPVLVRLKDKKCIFTMIRRIIGIMNIIILRRMIAHMKGLRALNEDL